MNKDLILDRITLKFNDPELESRYYSEHLDWFRSQIRLGFFTGLILLSGHSWIDTYFAGDMLFWIIASRVVAIACSGVLLVYSIYGSLQLKNRALTVAPAIVTAGVLLLIFSRMNDYRMDIYYVGVVSITYFLYVGSGFRFLTSLKINVVVFIFFELILIYVLQAPFDRMLNHNYYMLTANLIGGLAGYRMELAKRRMFLQKCQLIEAREEIERYAKIQEKLALHDSMTGLPNRRLLYANLEDQMQISREKRKGFGVLFIDLDNFKPANDKYGHAAGDIVLKTVAERIQAVMRLDDMLSRIGGDEYVLVVNGISDKKTLERVAKKVLKAIQEPIVAELDGKFHEIVVDGSVGICLYDGKWVPQSVGALVQAADAAMYEVKKRGKSGYSFVKPVKVT